MNKAFAPEWLSNCLKFVQRLLRADVIDVRCRSISAGATLELFGELVASAQCLEINFCVRLPLWSRRRKSILDIRLVPDLDQSGAATHRPIPYELKQFSSRHKTEVRIRISGPLPPTCDTLKLDLVQGSEQRSLAHLKFRVLDSAATEDRLLRSLKAQDLRLWVHNRSGCHAAQLVSATSGFLVAEFMVPPSDWSAFARVVDTTLTVELISPLRRIEVERRPIRLTGETLAFRTPRLALANQKLFPQPGNYRLLARLGNQFTATLPFEFLGEADMLRRIKVPQIHITAQTRAGELVPCLTTLHWEEHRAVLASMQITSDISAPETLVTCNVSISEGATVLRTEDVAFPLDRRSRTIRLEPLEFGVTGLQTQPKPARLTVAVRIAGEEKASTVVLVLPPERITNFEGQLSFEVKELPFDEAEYNQIVQRLRLCDNPTPQRGFWEWLQSKILRD